MRTEAAIALALALGVVCTQLAVADEKAEPKSAANVQSSASKDDELHFETVLTVHGEIVSIDPTSRHIILKAQGAGTLTVEARNEKELEGIKEGDRVVLRYIEGTHIRKNKPGQALPMASVKEGITAAKPGEPANGGGPQRHMTVVSVKAIDEAFQEVTLKGSDGSQETVMVENPEALEDMKVGDQVVITHSWAMALSLDKEN